MSDTFIMDGGTPALFEKPQAPTMYRYRIYINNTSTVDVESPNVFEAFIKIVRGDGYVLTPVCFIPFDWISTIAPVTETTTAAGDNIVPLFKTKEPSP